MERPQAVRTRTGRRVAALATLAGVLLLLAAAVAAPAQAAPGDLDLTFSGDGKQRTDFGFGTSSAEATVRQPDGKIVAVGGVRTPAGDDFALTRYNPNGSLDPSFSGDGKQATDLGSRDDRASGVAVQADGKIVAVGYASGDFGFVLARYNPNGSLDTSFSGDGKQRTDFGGYELATGVALQADGKIVVVGVGVGVGNDFALARYNPNGSLDTSFSGDGKQRTDFVDGFDQANAVAIQANGKIVAVGSANDSAGDDDFALARYSPNGSLDPGFSGDGKQTTGIPGFIVASAVALQSDGKIVAAGRFASFSTNEDFALARYNPNGSLDTSFSGDGWQTTNFERYDEANGVVLQTDGKIVAVGSANGYEDFALARYNPNGSLDTSFSGDGKQRTDFGGGLDVASAVALQGGKIVAVGGADFDDFALARYNPNGSLDTSFSGDGRQTTTFGCCSHSTPDRANAVAFQSDGKIVAVGGAGVGTSFCCDDFALARYNPSGSLDTSFSFDGKQRTDFGDYAEANAVALQANGKILVVGTDFGTGSGSDFALTRYNPKGSLDTSFSGDGRQTTDFGGAGDRAEGVALQADGKIVVVGVGGGGENDFALARYNPNGSLDTSFSGDGKQTTDFGDFDQATGVAIQGDGKIVAVGFGGANIDGANGDFALARYNSNGTLDASFSGDGRQTTDLGGNDAANGVALRSDGRILAVGGGGAGDFALARYNANGTLDTSFSGDGKQTTDFGGFDEAKGVTLQENGKIVAAGRGVGGSDFALARYNPNGSLDTSFSGDGRQTTDFGGGGDGAEGVALQADGKIVMAGVGRETDSAFYDFALARYHGG